jgi:hypothetical protein
MSKQVSNEQANKLIQKYRFEQKNSVNLENSKEVTTIQVSETVNDLIRESEQIQEKTLNKTFEGEKIRILVYFHGGESFTQLEFKKYTGKLKTLAATVSKKIYESFVNLKGKGKMNVLLEINGETLKLKSGRVYHMNRRNMKQGISALTVLQGATYLA